MGRLQLVLGGQAHVLYCIRESVGIQQHQFIFPVCHIKTTSRIHVLGQLQPINRSTVSSEMAVKQHFM
jgi:hypothetical protein